jgi:hypothetical protein
MKESMHFIIPIWIGMMVNSLLSIVDFLYLTPYSNLYLSAIGIGYIPFSIISTLVIGLSIETNRTLAKNENLNFKNISTFCLAFSFVLMILSLLIGDRAFFFIHNISLKRACIDYFTSISISIIPTSFIYLFTGILRGKGKPEKSIIFSALAVLFNIVLDGILLKSKLFESPVIACGLASTLSDALTAIFYFSYLMSHKYLSNKAMNIRKFIKNASLNSLEKLFSSSTLEIIISLFMAFLSIKSSSVYFSLQRYYQPLALFPYCFFEWIIYSSSKNIRTNKMIYPLYFAILFFYNLILIYFLDLKGDNLFFSIIYMIYLFIFLFERQMVAYFFSLEKGSFVNIIVFFRDLALFLILGSLILIRSFTLLTFGISNLLVFLAEYCIFIKSFKGKRQQVSTVCHRNR